ncbi:hypothetical protein [Mycobacterium paraintracellulare]|uniref:hypothetical protein n=1 Tax=Mycobacterium paraintracellulare TaxID=1138383 RepID=UPI001928A366|nr:hypothetical protein [Mycobacterium paraintracellulare]BCP14850.1 hypothetical protein MINTM021_17590 [Mycobacterium paraintracellulare]
MTTAEFGEWEASLVRVRSRGTQTIDRAANLVAAIFRGDDTAAVIVLDEVPDDDAGDMVHGVLRLCYALAQRNRTPQGLLAVQAAWLDIADDDWRLHRRNAALLMNSYMQAVDAANWDDFAIVGIDPSVHYNAAAEDFNQVITNAGEHLYEVLLTTVKIWRRLLPEISPASIENVAAAMRIEA